jgi:D-glycero-D-manno-heptose 1,7-bisphosphate phosphatase
MVVAASRELGFRPDQGFVVGDKACDIELGRRIGATTILVRTGYGGKLATHLAATAEAEFRPDHVVADLKAAATTIRKLLRSVRPEGDSGRQAA